MIDFEHLGALFGPGAPDTDLAAIRLRRQAWKHEKHRYFSRLIAILEFDLKMKVAKPLFLQRDSNIPTS